MNRILVIICMLLLGVLTACGDEAPAPAAGPHGRGGTRTRVEDAISDHALFAELQNDEALTETFQAYMEWVAGLGVPDALLVLKMMNAKEPTIDSLASVFHEKVEFQEWINLGHKLKDIMTVSYYQAKYPEVYPVAHRAGIDAEFSLIRHFARKKGYRDLPVLAYALVSPLVEHHATTTARLARRLKFNPEYVTAAVSEEELELAAQVYEAGGYHYKDRAALLRAAGQYLAQRATAK